MQQPTDLVTVTQKRYQCRHVHADGRQCGSPALRTEQFCYHHHTTRRPKPPAGKSRYLDSQEPFELPVVEDFPSALSVAAQLLSRIASNDLDHDRSGRLLYNLQIITSILDKASRAAARTAPAPKPEPLAELIADETHGLIAPITEYVPAQKPVGLELGSGVGSGVGLGVGLGVGSGVGAPSVPASSGRVGFASERVEPPPPPPERAYTPEEQEYFKNTVSNRGYEPFSEFLRPASITDEDIETHVNEFRRRHGFAPFTAIKDADGKLITIHELGARYTKPIIQLLREARSRQAASQQYATIPTLRASAEPRPRPKTRSTLRILKRSSFWALSLSKGSESPYLPCGVAPGCGRGLQTVLNRVHSNRGIIHTTRRLQRNGLKTSNLEPENGFDPDRTA